MNNTRDNGGPAYPCGREWNCDRTEVSRWEENGMSLLDYFAGHALAGELASQSREAGEWQGGDLKLAKRCYDFAEAMIYEKRRREGGAV